MMGEKSVPLDIELYQPASSLPEGKLDREFQKKPEIGLKLIERSLKRGSRPCIVLIDGGYGKNTSFLKQLEAKKLKYLGGAFHICKGIYCSRCKQVEFIDEITSILKPTKATFIFIAPYLGRVAKNRKVIYTPCFRS